MSKYRSWRIIQRWPPHKSPPLQSGNNKHIVVQTHSTNEKEEADNLKIIKLLPFHTQAENPDDQCAYRVENHSGSGGQFFGDGDSRKVEKSDGNDGT